jgi:hypothetical protein
LCVFAHGTYTECRAFTRPFMGQPILWPAPQIFHATRWSAASSLRPVAEQGAVVVFSAGWRLGSRVCTMCCNCRVYRPHPGCYVLVEALRLSRSHSVLGWGVRAALRHAASPAVCVLQAHLGVPLSPVCLVGSAAAASHCLPFHVSPLLECVCVCVCRTQQIGCCASLQPQVGRRFSAFLGRAHACSWRLA